MLGRTHALTGAAVCAGIAAVTTHPGPGPVVAASLVTAGAAVLPDIDHKDSTVSQSFGFATRGFAWLVAKASGGHRHGTHSLAGIAAFAAAAALATVFRGALPGEAAFVALMTVVLAGGLRALRLGGHLADGAALAAAFVTARTGYDAAMFPWLAGLGAAAHIAGDMLTVSGCPLAWPVSQRRCWLVPAWARLRTGHRAERWLITPVLAVAVMGLILIVPAMD